MEIVLTLLAVILLVVLPVLFLVLMVWGLFYAISRAIRGEKGAYPANEGPSQTVPPAGEAGPPSRGGHEVLK